MIHLQLNDEEKEILVQMLESCITDLRVEIAGTDNYNYKAMLKQRKEVLIKLQQELAGDMATQSMT